MICGHKRELSNFSQPFWMARGFTLIELLVVLALSAFVGIAVVNMVRNNVAISNVTEDSAQTSERSKFAIHALSRNIRLAGFVNKFSADSLGVEEGVDPIVFATSSACPASVSLYKTSCVGSSVVGNRIPVSDALAVEYDVPKVNPENDYTTCNGTSVEWGSGAGKATRIREVFTVYRDPATNDYSLVCGSFKVVDKAPSALPEGSTPSRAGFVSGNFVEVVKGISLFKVEYGLADITSKEVSALNYVDASQVATKDQRESLRAVRFALLVNTDRATGEANNNVYNLLGSTIDFNGVTGVKANAYRSVFGEVTLNNIKGGSILNKPKEGSGL